MEAAFIRFGIAFEEHGLKRLGNNIVHAGEQGFDSGGDGHLGHGQRGQQQVAEHQIQPVMQQFTQGVHRGPEPIEHQIPHRPQGEGGTPDFQLRCILSADPQVGKADDQGGYHQPYADIDHSGRKQEIQQNQRQRLAYIGQGFKQARQIQLVLNISTRAEHSKQRIDKEGDKDKGEQPFHVRDQLRGNDEDMLQEQNAHRGSRQDHRRQETVSDKGGTVVLVRLAHIPLMIGQRDITPGKGVQRGGDNGGVFRRVPCQGHKAVSFLPHIIGNIGGDEQADQIADHKSSARHQNGAQQAHILPSLSHAFTPLSAARPPPSVKAR